MRFLAVFPFLSKKFPVTPTIRGLVVGVIGVVLYGLAWLTNIGWFFVADALVWSALVVNLLLPWFNLRGLAAERCVLGPIVISEDVEARLAIDIRNRTYLPKLLVTIREHCPLAAPDSKKHGFLIWSAAPRSMIRAIYGVRCYLRGEYSFPPLDLDTSAPFGLFRANRLLKAPLEVMVYPQVIPMNFGTQQGGSTGQVPRTDIPRPSGELRGTLEYQLGDRINTIHWRNSARVGRLMVKEFDEIPQGEMCVSFNPGFALGQGKDNTLEYAIKIAASLADWSRREGRPFRMWPSGQDGEVSSRHRLMEHLALLKPSESDAVQEFLRHLSPLGVSVLVVSSADSETLQLLYQQAHAPLTTVILLEGFGPGETADAFQRLSDRGMPTVRCRRGDLFGALRSLAGVKAGGATGWSQPGLARVRRHD